MYYLLIDKNQKMIEAWNMLFKGEKNVEVSHGDLTQVICDAIVSPANSFGFMDGGIDYAISERLGWDLQVELQNKIKNTDEGELLVGQSMTLETGDKQIPYLISAPTMRVPMNFNIWTSLNAYLAMKVTLIAAKKHPNIEIVAVSGLCTGVGRMSPEVSAYQMYVAYLEIEKGQKMDFRNFNEAQNYQWDLNKEGRLFH